MIEFLRSRLQSRLFVLLHDLAWVPVAVYAAYWLRFQPGEIPADSLEAMRWMLGVSIPVFAASFWFFGLHRGIWRFISFPDLIRLIKAVLVGLLVSGLALFVLRRFEGVPRSIVVLFPILLGLGLTCPRLLYRWLREQYLGIEQNERKRALVVGAGRLGELVIRQLMRGGMYLPSAVLDPNRRMIGKEIHGVRVMGDLSEAGRVIAKQGIQIVILVAPDATAADVSNLVTLCAKARIPCRTVPMRMVGESSLVEDLKLRPITIEDLLRREPIVLNLQEITRHLHGKRVLVTGGGGSIGSELCRQIAAQAPDSLVVFESSEYNLYRIEHDLRVQFPGLVFYPVLGDVRQKHANDALFRRYAPQVVFHAAAYKHVPLLETNPLPAVQNNVLGTRLVADAADHYGAEQFVLISTDKAVNPTNVMGATKRAAEVYCQNLNARSNTKFITTRFGNVLGSVGSVVPLFEAQIASGGPVTVTHPEIRRYFMTIPEAVSLILQAASMGTGGEIFVLDMGEPVKIKELAEQLIRLAGYTPYDEIPIVFTGLRPGEKLYEELFHEHESLLPTSNPKILQAAHREVDWAWLDTAMRKLGSVVDQGKPEDVMAQLRDLVPEFQSGASKPPTRPQRPTPQHLRVVT